MALPASGFPTPSVQNVGENFVPYLKVTNYVPRLYFASEAEDSCIVLGAQRAVALKFDICGRLQGESFQPVVTLRKKVISSDLFPINCYDAANFICSFPILALLLLMLIFLFLYPKTLKQASLL